MQRKKMIGIFILVLSAGALYFAVATGSKSLRVRGWPTATARIESKEVALTDTAAGNTRTARYEARVTYVFEVDGREIRSNGLHSDLVRMNKADAQELVDGLGDTLEVHYDPEKPEESYAYPTPLVWPIVAAVIGLLGLLVGLGMLLGGGGAGVDGRGGGAS